MKMRFVGLGFGLLILLTSCAIYVSPNSVTARGRIRFGIEVSDVLRVFEPARGTGSTYYVGENVSFRILTTRDGYLTLTALDPDGRVYTFARNLYVRGGQTTVISGPDDSSVFSLVPPRGLQRVRAAFTPGRTSGRISYSGNSNEGRWTQSIITEVRDYDVRDIAETHFYIR